MTDLRAVCEGNSFPRSCGVGNHVGCFTILRNGNCARSRGEACVFRRERRLRAPTIQNIFLK